MNLKSKGWVIFYAVAIFLAGGVTGGLVVARVAMHRFFHPPGPEQMADRILRRMESRLDLTSDQVNQIRPILEKAGTTMQQVRLDSMKRVRETMDQSHAEIAKLLTPEQQKKFEEMEREHHEFEHRHGFPEEGGPGMHGPPPPHDPRGPMPPPPPPGP